MDRFWSKVDIQGPEECWEWKAARIPQGYGHFGLDGHRKRAHRVAYELTNGLIPEGLNCLHDCDNPPCVNPAHLFLGTQADNINDMIAKGRQHRISGLRGEAHGGSKLSNQDVLEIRRLYATDKVTQKILGSMFCVDSSAIGYIVRRKMWGHI